MKGIGVSPGIAIGKVLIKKKLEIKIKKQNIKIVSKEIIRLESAVSIAKEQVQKLYQNTLKSVGKKEAMIFEAHKMILDDPELFGKTKEKIKREMVNSEWALKEITDSFIEIFSNMNDEYMKERAEDVKDVYGRVIRILLGVKLADFSKLDEEVIIVAADLTPSDTAHMDRLKVLGFITERGGRTSHTAIMARTLELPAIVGVEGIINKVNDGDIVVFDGDKGLVYVRPEEKILRKYEEKKKEHEALKEKLKKMIGVESKTTDGFKVELSANIGTPNDVESIFKNGGEGIGLYRTEFLYMDRNKLPTEEEQFEAYKIVAERMEKKPIVIRTLDIGGDKELPYMNLPKEMNPFLGYRAIRLCLDRTEIFKTQLRSLLRASAYGNIKIMFPMISSIEELRKAKKILEEVKKDLRKEKINFNEEIEVGMMIEVPAAAIMSDLFAKEVDFFSIGTNDLIQYTTAVDRGNKDIAYLYNQFHPALLRLIKTVIDNGHKEGIWVGMCGEAAGDSKLISILIGMGLDEFSMSPISILKSRWIITNTTKKDMEKKVQKVISLATAEDVSRELDNIY